MLQRLVAIVVLLGWVTPGTLALAVGVHLSVEHHDSHAVEHRLEIEDLLRVAVHGHHHDLESANDHDHALRLDGRAPFSPTHLGVISALPTMPPIPAASAAHSTCEGTRRRGPPTALFTAHCALLT